MEFLPFYVSPLPKLVVSYKFSYFAKLIFNFVLQ